MPFIYSKNYIADLGNHVFPVIKNKLVFEKLVKEERTDKSEFITPKPATIEQLKLVHSTEYLQDLSNSALTPRTISSELPITKEIIALFVLVSGGTIEACRKALEHKWAVNLSGGFHHAFADKAEGFCYLNDLAVAVKVIQNEGLVKKVAIIDCDLHQGNGTSVIFKDDKSVFTFSIHQEELYPIKEKSDLDIHLPINTANDEYMFHLYKAIPKIIKEFKPDFVLYQAGADPYEKDQLGNLCLTIDGLKERDTFIFKQCQENNIPFAVTLGGGYAFNTDDTVQIHYNTCMTAKRMFN